MSGVAVAALFLVPLGLISSFTRTIWLAPIGRLVLVVGFLVGVADVGALLFRLVVPDINAPSREFALPLMEEALKFAPARMDRVAATTLQRVVVWSDRHLMAGHEIWNSIAGGCWDWRSSRVAHVAWRCWWVRPASSGPWTTSPTTIASAVTDSW